jgi:hypothetical protein
MGSSLTKRISPVTKKSELLAMVPNNSKDLEASKHMVMVTPSYYLVRRAEVFKDRGDLIVFRDATIGLVEWDEYRDRWLVWYSEMRLHIDEATADGLLAW